MKLILSFILALLCVPAFGQDQGESGLLLVSGGSVSTITLDTPSCTAAGTSCTLTGVTAADTIDCKYFLYSYTSTAAYVSDSVNGIYTSMLLAPASDSEMGGEYVFAGSAAGTITPTLTTAAPYVNLSCQTYKNVNQTAYADPAIGQWNTNTSTNPTSGTTQTPSANKELIAGYLADLSVTPTAGTGFTLKGNVTNGSTGVNLFPEYWIQTTATATNSPYTAASDTWIDFTTAFMPAGQTGGVVPFGGIYWDGAGASNGTALSASNMGTGSNYAFPGGWSGTYVSAVYNNTVTPPARTHSIWTSGKYSNTNTGMAIDHISVASESFNFDTTIAGPSTEAPSISFFFETTYTANSAGNLCDFAQISGATGGDGVNLQVGYDATAHLAFHMEITNGTTHTSPWVSIASNTWYWVTMQLAHSGNRQLDVYSYSGGSWTLLGTSTYAVTTGPSSNINFQVGNQGSCGDPAGTHVYYADIQMDPWGQAGFPVLP